MNKITVPDVPHQVLAKIKELAPAHGYAHDWQLMARDLLWQATQPDSFALELIEREARRHARRIPTEG